MSNSRYPHLELQLEFGRKSRDCEKFGICATLYLVFKVQPGFNQATLDYNPHSRILVLTVAESELKKNQPDKLQYFQGKSSVVFEEDWIAPDDIQNALEQKSPITIKMGEYPVIMNSGFYTLIFPV